MLVDISLNTLKTKTLNGSDYLKSQFINNEKFEKLNDTQKDLVFKYQIHIEKATSPPYYPNDRSKYEEYYENIKIQINKYIDKIGG